jgi:NAD(P)-dependent dehydrogenase (short-subunit alcohol dehydrogenase family)
METELLWSLVKRWWEIGDSVPTIEARSAYKQCAHELAILLDPPRHPGAGTIINVSSDAPSIAGPPGLAAYAAVKAAVQTFSRAVVSLRRP